MLLIERKTASAEHVISLSVTNALKVPYS